MVTLWRGGVLQNTEVTFDGMGYPKIVKRDLDANVRIDAVQALVMAVDCQVEVQEREGNLCGTRKCSRLGRRQPISGGPHGDELPGPVGAPSSPVGDVAGFAKVRV